MHNAPFMAGHFKDRREEVELLVSSTANRAITTARHFAKALGMNDILEEAQIYEATVPALLKVISRLPADVNSAMLFGHNPGFSDLANFLTEEAVRELSTCAIVKLDLNVDQWAEAHQGCADLVWLDSPKQHDPF